MTNAATAAQRWVDEIEKHEATKRAIMMKAAADCVPFNTLIKEAKAAAKNEGVGTQALNALLLERKHLANAAKVRENLEDEEIVSELEMLRDQVKAVAGIEDLFSFAADQLDNEIKARKGGRTAAARKAKSDALDDLADGEDAPPAPQPDQAALNAAALSTGIKPLH